LIEFELSFKQIFFFTILGTKLLEASKPITQILEQVEQNKRGKRGQEPVNVPKLSSLQTIQFSSVYFALIKESPELALDFTSQSENTTNSIPMLSLEFKWLEVK
jgi:hypothetical protein